MLSVFLSKEEQDLTTNGEVVKQLTEWGYLEELPRGPEECGLGTQTSTARSMKPQLSVVPGQVHGS